MRIASSHQSGQKCDIATLGFREGPAGRAAMAETYAARALGLSLTAQPEFWKHLDQVRAGARADDVARRYVRRDRDGQRLAVLAAYLTRGADADGKNAVKMAVWTTGMRAWVVDGSLEPGQPRRALRPEIVETIAIGAIRVARRGAGRCANPECSRDQHGDYCGARLASDQRGDYCASCATVDRRPRERRAEKDLFDAVIPVVLRQRSRQRSRRQRRTGSF